MVDISKTIEPKSDQLNADDLISGPRTITVTVVREGGAEQPIAIHFDGDKGKPYKPCKSMRRVMVMLWGGDGSAYAGRSMTLFRDPSVTFGPDTTGGIRISHMSHIGSDANLLLTKTRGKRSQYTVRRLSVVRAFDQLAAEIERADILANLDALSAKLSDAKIKRAVTAPEVQRLRELFVNKRSKLTGPRPPHDPETGVVEEPGTQRIREPGEEG